MHYSILAICQSQQLLENIQKNLSSSKYCFTFHGFIKKEGIAIECQHIEADLILIDYNLSSSSVKECLQLLRYHSQFKDKGVVVLVEPNNGNIHELLEIGVDDFIEMPINATTFASKLVLNINKAKVVKDLEMADSSHKCNFWLNNNLFITNIGFS